MTATMAVIIVALLLADIVSRWWTADIETRSRAKLSRRLLRLEEAIAEMTGEDVDITEPVRQIENHAKTSWEEFRRSVSYPRDKFDAEVNAIVDKLVPPLPPNRPE
jgi:hypothetical protein